MNNFDIDTSFLGDGSSDFCLPDTSTYNFPNLSTDEVIKNFDQALDDSSEAPSSFDSEMSYESFSSPSSVNRSSVSSRSVSSDKPIVNDEPVKNDFATITYRSRSSDSSLCDSSSFSELSSFDDSSVLSADSSSVSLASARTGFISDTSSSDTLTFISLIVGLSSFAIISGIFALIFNVFKRFRGGKDV